MILTINTAHPFFTELYEPVRQLSTRATNEDGEDGETGEPNAKHKPIVALDLLLLSLARTQGQLALNSEEGKRLLETFRREWSEAYRIELTA